MQVRDSIVLSSTSQEHSSSECSSIHIHSTERCNRAEKRQIQYWPQRVTTESELARCWRCYEELLSASPQVIVCDIGNSPNSEAWFPVWIDKLSMPERTSGKGMNVKIELLPTTCTI